MSNYNNTACQRMLKLIMESERDLNLLCVTPCIYARNIILNRLKYKLSEIAFLTNRVCSNDDSKKDYFTETSEKEQRNFTLLELEKYNGKDGNPAYVAVNGVIYDVTNNASWAAGTHFGLTAGKDLTSEFDSCHAGQSVLNKLDIIGKLVS